MLKDIIRCKIENVVQMLEHEFFDAADLPDHISSFTSYRDKLKEATAPPQESSPRRGGKGGGGVEEDFA